MPLRRSFLLHQSEQLRVEINGCILAQTFQFFVHRRDLDQARHVPAGSHRNSHMWHFKTEDFVKFTIQPDPINLIYVLPVLQGNNKVETLFDSDTANPENLRYIDNADATHFHVISGKVGRRRHKLAPLEHRNPRDVISHEAVTTFDEAQYTFAFSDAAGSANQNPNANDAHPAAQLSHCR